MEWLLDNPIAALSGPAFLLVYALFATAVIVASRLQIAAADTSGRGQPPDVTMDRDPYEVAYLRGAGNELLRFTIFDLTRQGFLRVADPVKAGKAPTQVVATGEPGTESLPPFASAVIAFYAVPQTTAQLFASKLPAAATQYGAATYQPKLEAEHLLNTRAAGASSTLVRLYGAFALGLFSSYRFLTALLQHHTNVIFLAILTVVALIALVVATSVPRLSRRGRTYLQRLTTALRPASVAPIAAGAGVLPILVAATGLGALAGTEYAPMRGMFPQQASSGASNCSGGCGSSSSSSSSCSSGSGCGGGCGG